MESNNARLKNKNKKNNEYKNRKMNRKSGLFLCFRPATMDGPVKRLPCPDGPSKPDFTYFAHMGGKEGMVFPKILPSDLAPVINKEEGDGGRREKSAICKLSRILKAVLPRTSLRRAKRKRSSERNLGQSSSFRLETSNSMKEYLASNKQNNLSDDEKLRVNSRCYSEPFTSTGPSRSLPRRGDSFRSNSAGPEQRQQDNAQKHGNGGYGFNGGQYYCLLVICLLVLVFWGKTVAIFCTSTWFYLVPRSTRYVSPQDGKEFSGIAFEKYKQKVDHHGRTCKSFLSG